MNPHSAAAADFAFYGIPLTVWLPLLTLLVTVGLGVLSRRTALKVVDRSNATARENMQRQLDRSANQFGNQLEHDRQQQERRIEAEAEQRRLEREMTLRREVYLEAASSLISMQNLLGRVTNVDYEHRDLAEEFAKHQATLAKIHIVGSQETIAAVMKYMGAMGPAWLEIVAKRVPLQIRKNAIEKTSAEVRRLRAQRQKLMSLAEQHSIAGTGSTAIYDAIMGRFDAVAVQWKEESEKLLQLSAEQAVEVSSVTQRAVELGQKLALMLPEAVLAVRVEMKLPLDQAIYKALWSEQQERVRTAWAEAMSQLAPGKKPPT